MQDLKLALRLVTKNPGFTAVVVFCLASSIATNSTVPRWLRGFIRRPQSGIADRLQMAGIVSNGGDPVTGIGETLRRRRFLPSRPLTAFQPKFPSCASSPLNAN